MRGVRKLQHFVQLDMYVCGEAPVRHSADHSRRVSQQTNTLGPAQQVPKGEGPKFKANIRGSLRVNYNSNVL